MYSNQRLADLEKILKFKYETLGQVQIELTMKTDPFDKIAIKLKIREQLMPEILQYETEYWSILEKHTEKCVVEEVDARNAIVKVVQEVKLIQIQPNKYSDEFMQKLQEILDKLNEPQTPAAAKLKAALPLIPLFMSYEVELDTEISLKRVFDRIKKLFKQAIDEKEKKTHK
jgi:hypothetical protein